MATYSSVLAWKISWTEEPGRLQSMVAKSQTRLNTYAIDKQGPAYSTGNSAQLLVFFVIT